MTTEDQYKWDLPTEMAVLINSHCWTFLPEKDVFDFIIFENSVPSNLDTPQVMKDFITQLMSRAETSVDLSLE